MSICVCECGAYIDSDAEPECLTEDADGTIRTLCHKCRVACPACEGDGQRRGPERGMPWFTCETCNGAGVVSESEAADWPPEPYVSPVE